MSQKININGLEIEAPNGCSVSVVNGQVTIDGQNYGSVSGKIVVQTDAKFTLHCDGDVEVRGSVSNGVHAKGSVNATNITGGVQAGGNVSAMNVTGGVNAQGDVKVTGSVTGGVNARNFTK